jgi:hypothetical protein
MNKPEGNPNYEGRQASDRAGVTCHGKPGRSFTRVTACFVIDSSFVIRHSSFQLWL